MRQLVFRIQSFIKKKNTLKAINIVVDDETFNLYKINKITKNYDLGNRKLMSGHYWTKCKLLVTPEYKGKSIKRRLGSFYSEEKGITLFSSRNRLAYLIEPSKNFDYNLLLIDVNILDSANIIIDDKEILSKELKDKIMIKAMLGEQGSTVNNLVMKIYNNDAVHINLVKLHGKIYNLKGYFIEIGA
jgi:hypothetical protein